MGLIWWILPALTGVIGLMLSFAGVGRLLKLRLAAGAVRFVFGIGFLGLAGMVTLAGLNMQTFKRLTYERVVATISFDKTPGADDTYSITMLLPEGEVREIREIKGDEFSLGAQVLTFKPMAQMLGYDSVYRLDFLEGRFSSRYNTAAVSQATSTGIRLYENPGLDVYALAKEQNGRFGIGTAQRDTNFGSAVYAPMADGLEYEVSLTQSALVLRPANAAATARLRAQE
ncbi:MAG: hypothetical protein QNI84_16035 [Henriciella sp.]|nr:hypothetical protein [Henriciella sp.]